METHHERLDGSGYPARTDAGDLDLESRILAVAEAFGGMVEEGPSGCRSAEEAIAELRTESGRLDPRVLDALARIV